MILHLLLKWMRSDLSFSTLYRSTKGGANLQPPLLFSQRNKTLETLLILNFNRNPIRKERGGRTPGFKHLLLSPFKLSILSQEGKRGSYSLHCSSTSSFLLSLFFWGGERRYRLIVPLNLIIYCLGWRGFLSLSWMGIWGKRKLAPCRHKGQLSTTHTAKHSCLETK